MRDIFPYFRKNENEPYYRERIEKILKGVPKSSGGKKVSKITHKIVGGLSQIGTRRAPGCSIIVYFSSTLQYSCRALR
jgi:hypothetical protein